MKNYLLKALAYDKQVRIYVVRCDNVLNNLAKRLFFQAGLAFSQKKTRLEGTVCQRILIEPQRPQQPKSAATVVAI